MKFSLGKIFFGLPTMENAADNCDMAHFLVYLSSLLKLSTKSFLKLQFDACADIYMAKKYDEIIKVMLLKLLQLFCCFLLALMGHLPVIFFHLQL